MPSAPTVVVTGAGAGIGRATGVAFAARGAQVARLARGRAGLDAAADDVRKAGGTPLAIPTDVADADQVERAADRVEAELGPVDVWVNAAFTSMFAPFHRISAAEFRRVTEVSYLGCVHGAMAALGRMRPRGRGTVVQVGSARRRCGRLRRRPPAAQAVLGGAEHGRHAAGTEARARALLDRYRVLTAATRVLRR